MNPEVLAILALMRTAWPGEWTDDQLKLWAADISKRDLRLAHLAVEHLRETIKFRPTTTEFIAAYQMVARKEIAPVKAIEGPKGDSAPFFAGLRAVFAAERPQHNHRNGAEGCPACLLHDQEAHKRDRHTSTSSSCARCAELADVFMEAAQ